MLHLHVQISSLVCCVQLFVTPRTVVCQAPLSMAFSRQQYWSGLLCPSPGDLPHPGIKLKCLLCLLHWQTGSLPLAPPGKPLSYGVGSDSKTNGLIPITCDFCLCFTVTRVSSHPQCFVCFTFAGATSLWHRLWE